MIKKLITVIALCATFLCFPQTIAAQEQRNVFLDVNNNKVDISIDMRDLSSITSLQLSLKVTSEKETLDFENFVFEFNEDIENKIQKWTYQPETGILNIYLADQEVTTLTAQPKLHLGTLSVQSSNLENIKVTVNEDALQYVNKENQLTQDEKTVFSTVTLGKKDDSQENEDNTNGNGNHGENTDDDSLDSQGDNHLNDADKDDSEDTKKPVKGENIQTGQVVSITLYIAGVLVTLIVGAMLIVLKKKEELRRR